MKYKYRRILDAIEHIPYGIMNIIKWIPIIWKDSDFDYQFLIITLEFKISKMRKFFESEDTMILGALKVAKELKTCEILLKRIKDDEYYNNAFFFHDKKWGDLYTTYTDCGDNKTLMNFHRPNINTEEEEEQEYKESRRLYKHSEYMKKQDLRMLTDIINKRLFGWWD